MFKPIACAGLFAAVLLASSQVAKASEFESPHVVHLTNGNYDKLTNDGKIYFIKYYAPWCGHCKRLAAGWKELGEGFKDDKQVAIAHVDCTTDRDVCTAAEIKGYPSLKLVHKGEEYKVYRGAREVDALRKFVLEAKRDLLTEST